MMQRELKLTEAQLQAHVRLIEALKAGKFLQGRGFLKSEQLWEGGLVCHCFLGVACEVSGLGTWEEAELRDIPARAPNLDRPTRQIKIFKYIASVNGNVSSSSASLPHLIRDYYGWISEEASIKIGDLTKELRQEVDEECKRAVESLTNWDGSELRFEPILERDDGSVSFMGLNDCGLSFPTLAKLLESRPVSLYRG